MVGTHIIVRDSSGQEILDYTSTGGWASMPTKEENQFYDAAASVYSAAYSAARAEIKSQESAGADHMAAGGFHVTA